MNQQRIEIYQICGRYKARIIQLKQVDDYYLVETNRGTKELREWPRVEVMRWSFAWREQMVREGFRNVERFLRTRDAKPYVATGRKGYTLTDHIRVREAVFPGWEQLSICGQIVARMHLAQAKQRFPIASELFTKEVTTLSLEEKRARERDHELASQYDFLQAEERWAANQFFPLLERMRKSVQLLEDAVQDESLLAVSHRYLSMENFCVLDDGRLFLKGFYRPSLSIQHRDTAHFIKQLYSTTGSVETVAVFLDGYEKLKPLSYQEYLLLLAFTLFPIHSWRNIEQFLAQPREVRGEKAVRQLENTLKEQQALDSLLQFVAGRAEHAGRGKVYEPI